MSDLTPEDTGRPFAAVTGASSGIGRELAAQFAQHGYDLLMSAQEPAIGLAAEELQERFAVTVIPVQADLAEYDGVEQLWGAVVATGRTVDAVVLNAGRGIGGSFVHETSLVDEQNV